MSGSSPTYQRQARTTGGGGIVRTPGPRLPPVQQAAVEEPARTALPYGGTMGALGAAMAGLGEVLGRTAGYVMEQETQERERRRVYEAEEFARTVPLRDADGNLTVPEQADPLTRDGRARNAGVALRLTNDIANRSGIDAVELRRQTENDPAAFQARWTGYSEGILQRVPAWVRPEAASTLARLGAEHARGVATDVMQTERRNQAQAASMRQQALERDLSGLAASGVTSGPEWGSTFARYQAHLNDMVRTQQITPEAATMLRDATVENTAAVSAVRWGQEAARSGRPAEEVLREFDGRMDTRRIPALTAPEVTGLRTLLNEGTLDQQQAILTGLSQGLSPSTMARTLDMVVEGQNNAPRLQGFVVAASNATTRPAMAREILQGMEVRRQLQPTSIQGAEWQRVLAEEFGGSNGPLAMRPDALARLGEAARSIYALRAVTGERPASIAAPLDSDRFRGILREIMPTVTYGGGMFGGGQRIPAPRLGMTQTQFDEHMAAMPPDALVGARASDGGRTGASPAFTRRRNGSRRR